MSGIEKVLHLAEAGRFDRSCSPKGAGIDLSKVRALGEGTRYDVCVSSASRRNVEAGGIGDVLRGGLCHSFTPDGRCVSLYKTLYTNVCGHECRYCSNSAGCKTKARAYRYEPEELADVVLSLYKGNYIEGLFLSSGIGANEDATMEDMIDAAALLRQKHLFRGYIHMKILPGASKENIRRAMELSDRVSVNIEAASKTHLSEISPTKDYATDILRRQRYVRELSRKVRLPAGQTTQMIVGAAGESDSEIFRRLTQQYDETKLKRAYYSVFTPVAGTALQEKDAAPLWREHRLYQMDWLYRVYRFTKKEINESFNAEGYIGDCDPKEAIALKTFDSPLDPNQASYDELIRIPGIGPIGAQRIIAYRKRRPIKKRSELSALGAVMKRAAPYLSVNGWNDTRITRWLT